MTNQPDEERDEADTARCRDDLMLKMAKQPPMTHAELVEKLRLERGEKKGRGRKPAPKD